MNKEELRAKVGTRLTLLSEDDIAAYSLKITSRAVADACYKSADTVLAYSALKREVNTSALVECAVADGKRVFFPVVNGRALLFAEVDKNTHFIEGRFGILEPLGRALFPEEIRGKNMLAIVPLVGFSERLERLGRGGGYYDRFFAQKGGILKFGLAFETQKLAAGFSETHDVFLDKVFTENAVYENGEGLK